MSIHCRSKGLATWTVAGVCALVLLSCATAGPAPGSVEASGARGSQVDAGTECGPAEYLVTLSAEDRRLVHVELRTPTCKGELDMRDWGADNLPGGYAAHVKQLKATTGEGESVEVKRVEDNPDLTWTVSAPPERQLVLNYDVEIKHDEIEWATGPDEAPYLRDDLVFLTGRAVFVLNEASPIRVSFALPEGWKVTTPWTPVPGTRTEFLLDGADEASEAFFVAGTHVEHREQIGDVKALLVLGNELGSRADQLKAALSSALGYYAEMFGGERNSRKLIVVNVGTEKDVLHGGVFGDSISLILPPENSNPEVLAYGRIYMSHLMMHEVFHLWLGIAIRFENKPEYWFQEGATDYLSRLATHATGIGDESAVRGFFATAATRYLPAAGTRSMRDASDDHIGNYGLVYSGGVLFALHLDTTIRAATNRTKGLYDVMPRLYQEFAVGDKPYSVDDVARIASEVAGRDLSELFDRYVTGTEKLPLNEMMNRIGLTFAVEEIPPPDDAPTDTAPRINVRIKPAADASPEAKELMESILGTFGNRE